MRKVIWLFVGMLFCSNLAWAQEDPARDLVQQKYQEIQNILATDKTNEGVRKKVVNVLESFTDFDAFGRMAMKRYWPQMSKKQRATFLEWFRQLIHRSYVRRFKANKEFNHEFRGITQLKGDKAFVRTVIRTDKTEADVDYKLMLNTGSHRAYDIIIDDVSLMRNYRKQFRNVLKKYCGKKDLCKKGFAELMQRIKDKVNTQGHELGDL